MLILSVLQEKQKMRHKETNRTSAGSLRPLGEVSEFEPKKSEFHTSVLTHLLLLRVPEGLRGQTSQTMLTTPMNANSKPQRDRVCRSGHVRHLPTC